MYKDKRAFSIVELVIVLTLIGIILLFGFSKLSLYFNEQNTLSSISDIHRVILKNKIEASLNNQKILMYFTKKVPHFFTTYIFKSGESIDLKIFSGSLDSHNIGNFIFQSNALKNFQGDIYFDNNETILNYPILFDEDGFSNPIIVSLEDPGEQKIYIKQDDFIKTGTLKLTLYGSEKPISLLGIWATRFSGDEVSFEELEIHNFQTGKFNYYSSLEQLFKVKISFLDTHNIGGFFELY